jgi:soluble lytic murein transglycosylase-like protein
MLAQYQKGTIMKDPIALVGLAFIVIAMYFLLQFTGNNTKLQTGIHYLQTGSTSLDYRKLAREDATNAGIPADLFERQIQQESGFNPNAISPAGAVGIAQIMPRTAESWGVDPTDPIASLSTAASHMAWYQNHYGSYAKALVCYNAGCDALQNGLPDETVRYLNAILGKGWTL